MGFLGSWVGDFQEVLTSPKSFFEQLEVDGYNQSMLFGGVNVVIISLISAIGSTLLSGTSSAAIPFIAVFGFVRAFLGLLLGAGIVHIFVYLLGGRGDEKTLAAIAYATPVGVLATIVSLIPQVGLYLSSIVALYALYIEIQGIRELFNFSPGRAAVSILLPVLILSILFIGPIVALVLGA